MESTLNARPGFKRGAGAIRLKNLHSTISNYVIFNKAVSWWRAAFFFPSGCSSEPRLAGRASFLIAGRNRKAHNQGPFRQGFSISEIFTNGPKLTARTLHSAIPSPDGPARNMAMKGQPLLIRQPPHLGG